MTDGGDALFLVAAERARDFQQKSVYLLGIGESVETPVACQMEDFTAAEGFGLPVQGVLPKPALPTAM